MVKKKPNLDKSTQDNTRSVIVAAVNAIPLAGGPVASLLNDYLPNSLEKRKNKLLLQMNEDLEQLKTQFDEKVLNEEYFLSVFMQAFRQMLVNDHQEKVNAFRAIILNSLIVQSAAEDEALLFLGITERLSPLHIKLLKIFSNPQEALSHNVQAKARLDSTHMGGLSVLTSALLPDYSTEHVKVAFKELHNLGIHDTPEFNVTMSGHGITQQRLTEFGREYLDFITLPSPLGQ